MKKIKGILLGTRIVCKDKDIIEKYIFLGDEAKKLGSFSVIEALYLIEKGILEVYDKGKNISFNELLEKGKELTGDENFYIKYVVFKDLMNRGYVLATGLKFGTDFRVYDKKILNENNKDEIIHSKFLVKVMPEEYISSFSEIAGNVRLARAVNKSLIYAIVDKDNDVIYYQIEIAKI